MWFLTSPDSPDMAHLVQGKLSFYWISGWENSSLEDTEQFALETKQNRQNYDQKPCSKVEMCGEEEKQVTINMKRHKEQRTTNSSFGL